MALRNHLLAAYLESNPVWQQYIEIFEEAFGNWYDDYINGLATVRDTHFTGDQPDPTTMRSPEDYHLFARTVLVGMARMLGFSYPNFRDRLFSSEDYLRIIQNIPLYLKSQGNESFVDFFAFCLNTVFKMKNTWTENYVDFVEEGNITVRAIDGDIYGSTSGGGHFYPTSHVHFEVDAFSSFNLSPDGFRDFFNYIAPINLVLLATVYRYSISQSIGYAMEGRTTIIVGTSQKSVEDFNISASGSITIYH